MEGKAARGSTITPSEGTSSLEDLLSREAVARIQTWLQGRAREKRYFAPPRLTIKFCGGCNPRIERGVVADQIQKELKDKVKWVSGEEERDFILVINGCPTACADKEEIRRGGAAIVISGELISP